MKKKIAMMCMAVALCLCSGITTYAAPEIMADGTVFDAEYYAQNNPDVAAVMGVGKDALYQHYKLYGANEGRAAYDAAAYSNISSETQKIVPVAKLLKRKVSHNPNNSVDGYEVYKYDGQGRVVSIKLLNSDKEETGRYTYEYNEQGKIAKEIHGDDGHVYILYTYDAHGNPIKNMVFRDGVNTSYGTNDYTYDSQGNIIEDVEYVSGKYYSKKTYKYNSQNKLIEEQAFGRQKSLSDTYIYTYDNKGNLIKKERFDHSFGGAMVECTVYVYDNRGNMLESQCYFDGRLAEHYVYTYDARGIISRKDEYNYSDHKIFYYDDNGDVVREEWRYDSDNKKDFMWLYMIYEY